LDYLTESYRKARIENKNPINFSENSLNFIKECVKIIENFAYTSLTDPDIFPD